MPTIARSPAAQRLAFCLWVSMLWVNCGSWIALGQPPAADAETAASDAAADKSTSLASEQKSVAQRFGRLEDLLLRAADLEAGENPTRAALLQQAVQLSKQAQLTDMLANAASRLEQGQYSEAIESQKASRENLQRLLQLLQSENREERIREQRDEVRRWIEETDRLLRLQSSLRGRTEGGQDTQQSAGDQGKLADKALEIAEQLRGDAQAPEADAESQSSPAAEDSADPSQAADPAAADEAADGDPSGPSDGSQEPQESAETPSADDPNDSEKSAGDAEKSPSESSAEEKAGDSRSPSSSPKSPNAQDPSQPGDGQPGDKQQGDKQQGDKQQGQSQQGQSQQGNSQQGDSQQGDSQQGDSQQGDSQQGQSQQGESQQGESQQGQQNSSEQQSPPQSPTERAKQRIEEAQQKMKEAQEKLKSAEREGAVEKQREAEEQLRNAIEELAEILRQLREEEVERSLASLETRLRRMLDMQNKVLDETQRLQEIGGEEATRQVQIMASKLSLDERKILAEGERALLLLREEGSSAAFPEAVEQLNTDIGSVADRLNVGDVGPLTVAIEEEIVSSLEEMIEALVQVQKENREKQQQQQQQGQQPSGQPGDQPLVDKLAELRLVRTLQVRINQRTNTLSKLLTDPSDVVGQAQEADILTQLRGLSERQSSIQQVTRDIVVGKGE